MKTLGYNLRRDQIKTLLYEADHDNSGSIDFPEFLDLITQNWALGTNKMSEEEMMQAFKLFDDDGDGSL